MAGFSYALIESSIWAVGPKDPYERLRIAQLGLLGLKRFQTATEVRLQCAAFCTRDVLLNYGPKRPKSGNLADSCNISAMPIRHRPMMPKDVPECAEIIAAHPIIGPRYGRRIRDLAAAWLRMLRCEGKRATVFQAGGARAPICFVGISVFVSDDFVREMKAAPGFWVGPELVKRILRGDSPILSDRQLRQANSRGGMNLLTWEGCIRPGHEARNEIHRYVMTRFIEEHRGFLWKEVISSQIESMERFQWTLKTGGMLWNPSAGRYEKSPKIHPKEIIRKPHLVGITREIELADPDSWTGSWVGTLFDYSPPKCGFSRSEQHLLLKALEGGTDRELSESLEVSLTTIKKMWLSAYRRAEKHVPELKANHLDANAKMTRRGKEKKRRLLAYLREHLEELRPASRKLLEQAAGQRRPSDSSE